MFRSTSKEKYLANSDLTPPTTAVYVPMNQCTKLSTYQVYPVGTKFGTLQIPLDTIETQFFETLARGTVK